MRRAKHRKKTGSIRKMAELAIAVPQVVATRTIRMLEAGAHPGVADRAEFSRMSTEKVQAFWESIFGMGTQMVRTNHELARAAALQCWRLWMTPWWLGAYRPAAQAMVTLPRAAALIAAPTRSQRQRAMSKLVEASLTPIHKRATANARRLGRGKKR